MAGKSLKVTTVLFLTAWIGSLAYGQNSQDANQPGSSPQGRFFPAQFDVGNFFDTVRSNVKSWQAAKQQAWKQNVSSRIRRPGKAQSGKAQFGKTQSGKTARSRDTTNQPRRGLIGLFDPIRNLTFPNVGAGLRGAGSTVENDQSAVATITDLPAVTTTKGKAGAPELSTEQAAGPTAKPQQTITPQPPPETRSETGESDIVDSPLITPGPDDGGVIRPAISNPATAIPVPVLTERSVNEIPE